MQWIPEPCTSNGERLAIKHWLWHVGYTSFNSQPSLRVFPWTSDWTRIGYIWVPYQHIGPAWSPYGHDDRFPAQEWQVPTQELLWFQCFMSQMPSFARVYNTSQIERCIMAWFRSYHRVGPNGRLLVCSVQYGLHTTTCIWVHSEPALVAADIQLEPALVCSIFKSALTSVQMHAVHACI